MLDVVDLPPHLRAIFRYVKGTPHEISEQKWMDFVPGHRLMIATEISATKTKLHTFYGDDELFTLTGRTPFMTNYSSDYYLTDDEDHGIYWLDHSQGVSRVAQNMAAFLETILECYVSGAYKTDDDGFLDLDDEKELEIGQARNPDCDFWNDE